MWHLQETYFKHNSIGKLKVKVWKKIYYESFNKKEAGVAILIPNKTDFRAKKITRKGYYIMIKWPIHQKDIAILNGKCKNNNAEKYVKKKTDTNEMKKRQFQNYSLRLSFLKN